MEREESRRRKVLFDRPTSNDEFSGGSHKRTASSLANTIAETKSIGLEGKWGSGKSTTVEIAAKLLEASPEGREYYVFTFDLWTNQNGSFRRAFLESLLTWLEGVDDTKSDFISKIRDRIRDRVVSTRTENTKVFNTFGLAVLVFMLALPWIYMWLSPFALQDDQVSTLTYVALAFLAFMVLGTLVHAWLIHRKTRPAQAFASALSRAISLFSTDAQTTHITQNIREVDPTLTAFENTLKEILSAFQTEKRSIIIVFDNIDRLPSERIVEAWSDIRSVLSTNRDEDGVTEKVTVIVPYDRQHVLRAISHYGDLSEVRKDDIFRKSFDAIFSVAPPVVSDAAAYFYAKLEYALGGSYHPDVAYRVFKIYELTRVDESATPRQIIYFINSIAILWEQWGDVIALPTIAVFVQKRDEIAENPSILRKVDAIDPRIRELSGDKEISRNLAALWFNVDPKLAFQILLNQQIEQVFTAEDEQAVSEVSSSAGFEIVLPEVFEENAAQWARESFTQFKFAARNLSLLGAQRPGVSECKARMLSAMEELEKVPPEGWESSTELLSLYRICSPEEAARLTSSLGRWLLRSVPEKEEDRTFAHGQNWIGFVSGMYEAAAPLLGDGAKDRFAALSIPSSGEFTVGVAYDAADHGLKISQFKRLTPATAVIEALRRRLLENPSEFFHAWPQLSRLTNEQEIHSYLEQLAERLDSTDESSNTSRLGYLIGTFNMLFAVSEEQEPALAARKRLVTSGSLYYYFGKLLEAPDEKDVVEARADILWLILNYQESSDLPQASHHPVFGDVSASFSWMKEILVGERTLDSSTLGVLVGRGLKHGRLSSWIRRASKTPGRKGLVYELVKAIVKNDGVGGRPSLVTFVSQYEYIKSEFPEDMESLLVRVGAANGAEDVAKIDVESLPLSLVSDVAGRSEGGWIQLLKVVDSWLRSLNDDTWKDYFEENGSGALQLLRSRVSNSGLTLPAIPFRDVVVEHVVAVLEGEVAISGNWDFVVDALPSSTREALPSEVFQRLNRVVVSVKGLECALAAYPALLSRVPFSRDEELAVEKIVMPAVQSTEEIAATYLNDHRVALRKALKAVSPSLLGQVQDLIGNDADGDEPAARERRQLLREWLELPSAETLEDEAATAEEVGGDSEATAPEQSE